MKPIELDLNDVNDPDAYMALWIGNRNQDVEIYIAGLLNMQSESLRCVLSKEDAVKLAKTILENIKE